MKLFFKWVVILSILPFLNACDPSDTQEDNTLDETLPLDPDVKMGELDNGLKYYIRKNQKPENRAELRLVVNAGSINEDEDQLGLAHFTEHMLFNGTENFEKNDLIDFFELNGMKFGAHVNAYTSFDETVYMLKPRTDSLAIFDMGFQVLEDWAHLASFDEEEIDKERGVVIEEWRLRLGPENRMLYQYLPVLFYNSHYADRLPIGTKEVLENFDYETIKRFYKDWYRPDLMAVVAVGDFDVEYVENKIKEHFAGIGNPETPRERKEYDVPDHKETLVKVVTDIEASHTTINIQYKHEKKHGKTVKDYRNYLMGSLVGEMTSQRYEELRQQENPPFMFAYSGYGGMLRTKDAYTTYAMVNDDGIESSLEVLLTENQRILQHGFTGSELKRAKKEVLNNLESRYNERDKMESRRFASEYINHFLNAEPIPGIIYEYEKADELLPGIELDELNDLPKKWISDENVVIIVTGPDKPEIDVPSNEDVLALFEKSKTTEVAAYEDSFTGSDLMTELPEEGEVANEKVNNDLGITEVEFANGATLIMKSTDYKNDEILFSAYSYGGASLYPDSDYPTVSKVSDIIGNSGISDFSEVDLQKLLAGKKIKIYPVIQEIYEGIQGSVAPEDMETFLQLQYLYFTSPRMDAIAFESYKQRQKMMYENLDANPQYYFMKEYLKILYNDHPRVRIPDAEDFDKIDLELAHQVYKERFANAGDFVFFMVGAFDIEEVMPMMTRYIGGLPSNDEREMYKNSGISYPEGNIQSEVKKGSEPKSTVSLTFTGPFEWDYQNRFNMSSLTDVLAIKLRESMREDKGGVYGVRVSPKPSKNPVSDYMVNISFSCSPENVDDLINTAMNEINLLKSNGASDQDLTKVKETMLRIRETDLKENKFWIKGLEQYHKHRENPMIILDFENYVENLTSEDIKSAANSYLDESRMVKVVLNPEVENIKD